MAPRDNIKITISSGFDAKGIKAAIQGAQQLKAAYAAIGKGVTGDGGASKAAAAQAVAASKIAQAQAQAQAAILRVDAASSAAAVSAQKLATAQQQTAVAAQRVAQAEQATVAATARAEQAQLRLAAAHAKAAQSASQQASSAAVLPRTIAGLSHEAAAAAKGLLGIGAAIGAIKGGYELATLAANAEAARTSFDRMAASAGTSGQALLASLREAASGTVAQTQLIQSANTALLLLGGDVATKLPQLLQVARASAQALGQDVGFVFDSLVTGISRGSTELIDNAGITLSATEAYDTYAASIGKSAAELTKAERSQAILNGVLTAGQGIIAQTGTATETAAVKMQRATAAFEDLKVAAGAALLPIAGNVAEATTAMLTFGETSAQVSADILSGASSFDEYRAKLDAINDPIAKAAGFYVQLSEAQFAAAQAMIDHGASAAQASAAVQTLAAFEVQLTGATEAQRDAFTSLAPAIAEVANSGEYGRAALAGLMEAFMNGSLSADQLAAAVANLANSQGLIVTAASEAATAQQTAAIANDYQAQSAAFAAANNIELSGQLGIMAAQAAYAAGQQEYAAQAIANSGVESAIDAQQKAAQADATALVGMEAQAAADAFIALHPNISASGAASAAAAAGISPLIAQLIQATLRAREAAAAVAAFNAQGGIRAQGVADHRAGERSGGKYKTAEAQTKGADAERALARNKAMLAAEAERAKKAASRAVGGGGGGARATGGAKAKGAGGGANPAVAAGQKQVDIETTTQNKLADVRRKGAQKLQEIDQQELQKLAAAYGKFAQQQIKAMEDLNRAMAGDQVATAFAQQLNDFDKYGKDLTKEQQQEIAQREAAEVAYNQRMTAAREEAAKVATDVDAEAAKEIYEARKQQAERQREIDQGAAEARATVGKKQKGALEQDIAEAQAANDAQMAHDVQMAIAAAEERKRAKKQEVDDIKSAAAEQRSDAIAASEEQANAVITNSERSTQKVLTDLDRKKKKWDEAKAAVKDYNTEVANVQALPTATTGGTGGTGGGGGGGAQNAAAGGFHGVTSGPTTIRVGDNPGGVEMVSVTPLSGKGQTRANHNLVSMAGGGTLAVSGGASGGGSRAVSGGGGGSSAMIGTLADAMAIIVWLSDAARQNQMNRANDLPNFVKRLGLAAESLNALTAISEAVRTPTSPVDPEAVRAMVADMTTAITILAGSATKELNTAAQRIMVMQNAAQRTAEVLGTMAEFRKSAFNEDGKLASPIPAKYIEDMVAETVFAVDRLNEAFTRNIYGAEFRKNLQEWVDGAGAALDLLSQAADFSKAMEGPITSSVFYSSLNNLADTIESSLEVVQARLIPLTEEEATALQAWSESAGAVLDVLHNAANFGSDLEKQPPLNTLWPTLNTLADTARDVLNVIQMRLVPLTEEQAAALKVWSESAGAAIDTLAAAASFVTDLKESKADGYVPLALLRRLASLSADALAIVQGALVPMSEEQQAALERWRDSSGAAIDVLASVASLYGDVKDISGGQISAAMLHQLAADARNAASIVNSRLVPYTEEQTAALKRYAEAVGASTSALSDALGLRKAIADAANAPAPTEAMLRQLARDDSRILSFVAGQMIPLSEKQVEQYTNYGDAVGAAAGALQSALGLSGAMFADYVSPSDAQLKLITNDAKRMVSAIATAAKVYDTEGLEAAKLYGEALGGIASAFTETLNFNAALSTGDFELDVGRLDTFMVGAGATIRAAGQLAQQAAQIPAGNLTALNSTATALNSFGDAMIKLDSLPIGTPNLPSLGGGGGSTNVTFAPGSIVVNGAAGQNVDQLASLVASKLQQSMRGYR